MIEPRKMTHIVGKQIIDVTFSPDVRLHNVQEQLGYICRQTLPVALEKVCNAICAEAYWIKLNKISLDLGTLPVAVLEEKMSEKAIEKLAEALTTAIEAGGVHSDDITLQKKMPASPVELLKRFLSAGTLPAWIDSRSVNLGQLFDRVMATAPEALCHFLRHASGKNSLCKRLAVMLQEQQLKALAVMLTKTTVFDTLIDELFAPENTAVVLNKSHSLAIKTALLSYLLRYDGVPAGSASQEINVKNISKEQRNGLDIKIVEYIRKGKIFREDPSQYKKLMQQLKVLVRTQSEALAQLLLSAGKHHKKYSEITALLKQNTSSMPEVAVNDLSIAIGELMLDSASLRSDIHELMTSAGIVSHNEEDKKLKEAFSGNKAQACTINNAGLVILWPGIPSLLETCGLIREHAFVGEEATERAVLLLQYAVGGQQEVPEFELPLNKILCGIAIDTSVATSFTPTAAEKAAVQDLLQTVIAEWSVLKNSAPEALQVNFLQRKGTVTPQGDHWQLNVERQTADVLLDRLPWRTGVIKLPWMNHIVYTKW